MASWPSSSHGGFTAFGISARECSAEPVQMWLVTFNRGGGALCASVLGVSPPSSKPPGVPNHFLSLWPPPDPTVPLLSPHTLLSPASTGDCATDHCPYGWQVRSATGTPWPPAQRIHRCMGGAALLGSVAPSLGRTRGARARAGQGSAPPTKKVGEAPTQGGCP